MAKRIAALGVCLLLLSLTLAGLRRLLFSSSCREPIFLVRPSNVLGHPAPPLAAIVQQAGGLPTGRATLNADNLSFSSQAGISPAASWTVSGFTVVDHTPVQTRVLDDDPTYGVTFDVEVHYADGSTRVLRWTTWRYGLVLCPIVIPYGDGPPWKIEPLD